MIRKKRVQKKTSASESATSGQRSSLYHLKKKSTRTQPKEQNGDDLTFEAANRMENLTIGTKPACKPSLSSSVLRPPGGVDQAYAYARNIRLNKRCFQLPMDSCYAFPNWNAELMHLVYNYVLVEAKRYSTANEDSCDILYLCNCSEGESHRERLIQIDAVEDLSRFKQCEEANYCLHAKAAAQLKLHSFEDDEDAEVVQQISTIPFLAAAHDGDRYGLLKRLGRSGKLTCQQCPYQRNSCGHVQAYRDWCRERDVDPEVVLQLASETTEEFNCVSFTPIPYPLTKEMKETYERLAEPGLQQFPRHLVPDCPTEPCSHGNNWDDRDPIEQGWVRHDGVKIHLEEMVITSYKECDGSEVPRIVYYRPTVGRCSCRRDYDGCDDLLHNLDNKNMFYFGFMLKYMHDMVYARKPLKAAERSANKTRAAATTQPPLDYRLLRRAWNSWARRLSIPWPDVFCCPVCGPEPSVIVCDGTAIGFRRDFLSTPGTTEDSAPDGLPSVEGSKHTDRVFIKTKQARDLLLRFSGEKRGQRAGCKNGLTDAEFKTLITLLSKEGHAELVTVLRRVKSEGGNRTCPSPYKRLFSELAKNTPICGMLQTAGSIEVMDVLTKVARGEVTLGCPDAASTLQKFTPVLFRSLRDIAKGRDIPEDVQHLVHRICSVLDQTFQNVPIPPAASYPAPPAPSMLSFFPGLHQKVGLPRYAADTKPCSTSLGSCRKESYGHPSLTPGIFTMFCRHGVCYGFDCMTSCESPRHPFEIFRTRFSTPPHVIVYDNACKLHQYTLNREPHFFRNTLFLVDRFHFRGHIGCSLGYCMDEYRQSVDIATINSQVNEQANAGLIRIQPQLSYMTPSNFVFHASLFLAVRNLDAITKLS